jgi:hypothetical protein
VNGTKFFNEKQVSLISMNNMKHECTKTILYIYATTFHFIKNGNDMTFIYCTLGSSYQKVGMLLPHLHVQFLHAMTQCM